MLSVLKIVGLVVLAAVVILGVADPSAMARAAGVTFTVHSARDGAWSDPQTWQEGRICLANAATTGKP